MCVCVMHYGVLEPEMNRDPKEGLEDLEVAYRPMRGEGGEDFPYVGGA